MRRLICICTALAAVGLAGLGSAAAASASSAGLAPTPPMGWNSYNAYACDNGAQNMEAVARFIHDSGLESDGYQYVNSDGCYDDNEGLDSPNTYGVFAPTPQDPETCGVINGRLPDGELFVNPYLFPPSDPCANNGFELVGNYVHGLGLKLGLYLDASNNWNCEEIPGSYQFDGIDANTLASWGVDYVKADWGCADSLIPPASDAPSGYIGADADPGNQGFGGPTFATNRFYDTDQETTQIKMFTALGQALARTRRRIVYSIAGAKTVNSQDWDLPTAQLVRPTGDSNANFTATGKRAAGSVVGIVNADAETYDAQTGPNHWIDPDIMEVGNGSLTAAEDQSEMSMFSEMADPLMISTNLCPGNCGPDTAPATSAQLALDVSVLGNRRVIAVDQDRLGAPARIVGSFDGTHLLMAKPLAAGDVAVTLFNESTTSDATMSTTAAALGLPAAKSYRLENLWTGQVTTTSGAISVDVPVTATVMYRVSIPGRHAPFSTAGSENHGAAGGNAGGDRNGNRPTPGAGLFTSLSEFGNELPHNLLALACTSSSQCVAGDIFGSEVSFNPAAPQRSAAARVDGNQSLVSLACPSGASVCVGLDRSGDAVSFVPGARGWSGIVSRVDSGNEPTAISCPAATECVVVDGKGNEITLAIRGGVVHAVSASAIDPDTYLGALSCPTAAQCTAVGGGGNNGDSEVSFDPQSGVVLGAGVTSIDPDTGNGLASVACPSASQCTAVDGDGNELTFEPLSAVINAAGIVALEGSGPSIGSGSGVMNSVSCPTAGQCTTVDDDGNEVSFDPATGAIAGGGPQLVDPFGNGLQAISCQADGTLCTAVDLNADAVSFVPSSGVLVGGPQLIDPSGS